MATTKGIAKISGIFDRAYSRPIDGDAYSLWTEIFASIDDSDLIVAAMSLAETRAQYMRGQVTPDEITRELQEMGVYIYHRKEDPAFVAANADAEKQFREDSERAGVSLAAYRKMDEEGGKAIDSYMRRE